jgi:hypothetical protein
MISPGKTTTGLIVNTGNLFAGKTLPPGVCMKIDIKVLGPIHLGAFDSLPGSFALSLCGSFLLTSPQEHSTCVYDGTGTSSVGS